MASEEGGGVVVFSSGGESHCVIPHPPLKDNFPGKVISDRKETEAVIQHYNMKLARCYQTILDLLPS